MSLSKVAVAFMTLLLVQHCYKTNFSIYGSLMLTFWDHRSRSSLSGILSCYGAGNCSHSLTFWLGSWEAFAKHWASQLAVLHNGSLLTNLFSSSKQLCCNVKNSLFPEHSDPLEKKRCNCLFLVSFLAGCRRRGAIVRILTRGVMSHSWGGASALNTAGLWIGELCMPCAVCTMEA